MSADNYWAVVPVGDKFGVAIGFESNEEWPTPKPASPLFDTAAEAAQKAYELDDIDWAEYGVKLHPDAVRALHPQPIHSESTPDI